MNKLRVMIDREARNEYGFPFERLAAAQAQAAEVRARNFPSPCNCEGCVIERNLPGVLRLLEKFQLRSSGHG